MLTALVLAALGGAYLVVHTRGSGEAGLRWLWPAGCLVVAVITVAACFGVYARLPGRRWDVGEWVGLPGPSDGDASGHTMPGLVKAEPFFCAFSLVVFNLFGIALVRDMIVGGVYGVVLGALVATSAWWFVMLCFSRGWIKEAD